MSNLNIEKIEEQLISIIADVKNLAISDLSLQPEDDFINQYNLSSMDAVSLSVKISHCFSFGFGQEVEDIDGLASLEL